MLVVVERGEELLKSQFLRAWFDHLLVFDKISLEVKIY